MTASANFKNQDIEYIEYPNLYQDLNILLAELIGWQNLEMEDDVLWVYQSKDSPQKFNFLDHKVIFPIAKKYNKTAVKINNSQWICEYLTKEKKSMLVISEQEEVTLAMVLVLEFHT